MLRRFFHSLERKILLTVFLITIFPAVQFVGYAHQTERLLLMEAYGGFRLDAVREAKATP